MNVPGRWLLCAAVLSTACSPQQSGHVFQREEEENEVSTGSCGVERWSIKTGSDSAVGQVNLTPQDSSIAALRGIAVPAGFGANSPREVYSGSPELQNFRLTNVTLTQYKLENDSDYHLILRDGAGNTMIAEIPYPGCLTGSSWTTQITNSRNAFDAKYAVTTSFQTANDTVTVTGVGFFDVLHGQTGVAPNGIELHAVLGICWGLNCSGGATADFALAASPGSVSGSGSSSVSVSAVNGFTGTVSLSASGAPSGASAALSPTSVAGAGTSTLTLTPGNAAAGTYPITVTGTSGALSHTTSVSWTVPPSGGGGTLTNPGFESGLTGWTGAGSTSVSATAHGGLQAALVGSTSPTMDSSLAQTFTLPGSATAVTVWYQVHCPDTITYDWASATLKDNTSGTTTTLLANTCSNAGTWQQASAAATGGHSVTLTLSNHDDNYASDPTYTLYDDVAIASGTPDTTPPTTSITAPVGGSTVSGTVTITATASDNVGVTKIELYVDGSLLGSGAASPFSASWNTTGAANGAHSLTSKAYDAAGNVGTSSAVPVTVSNGAVSNPIVNPGFEAGTLAGWTASGVARASPYPHTGSYACSLGSSSPSTDSSVSQTFTMPAGANTLTLWVRIFCPDTITYDWASASLTDNVTGTTVNVLPNTCTNNGTWVQASAAVTSMRGHSVTLSLKNHDDNYSGDATYTDYDDLSVQ